MGTESVMLLCLSYCVKRRTLARGFCDDCRNSLRENQKIEVIWVMHSLDVSRCAGDIGKPSVNTTEICVCGIGRCNVDFVAFGGAGDLRFAMNPAQTKMKC